MEGKSKQVTSSIAMSLVVVPGSDWRFQSSSLNRAPMCQLSHAIRKISRPRLRSWRCVYFPSARAGIPLTIHLQAVRQSEDQKFAWYSHSLTSAKESQEALQAVIAGHNGETPDSVFLCAGGSKPKFFVEMSEEELVQGMDMGYWVQAWTAWVCVSFSEGWANLMVQAGREQRDDQDTEKGQDLLCLVNPWIYGHGRLRLLCSCKTRSPWSRRRPSLRTPTLRHRRARFLPMHHVHIRLRGGKQDEAQDHSQDRGVR